MRYCSECGAALPQEAQWCPNCGAESVTVVTRRSQDRVERGRREGPSRTYSPEDLRRPWKRAANWGVPAGVLAVMYLVVTAIAARLFIPGIYPPVLLVVLGLLGLGAAATGVPAVIFWFTFFYRAWDQAQSFTRRTTPGKAVGLNFVPLFSLYWVFVSYLGLAKDMNAELHRRRPYEKQLVKEELVLAACISGIVTLFASTVGSVVGLLIPGVGLLITILGQVTSIATIPVLMILAVQFRNAAVALAETS